MGLEKLIGGFRQGYKDYRSSGYGFEEFTSLVESKRGVSDHRARYDHHMRFPANYGRPPMGHMADYDEDDSDSDEEEFFESSRSHHTTVSPHHQGPPHLNFMPLPPMAQPHYNEQHEDAYYGTHGMQQHGAHGLQQHGGHGMQHYGHQDRLIAPHMPPHHVYMNPIQQQHTRVNNSGSHHRAGWGRKGL